MLLALFLGVYSVAQYIDDSQLAGLAAGQGARLGSQLGNANYLASAPATGCQTSSSLSPKNIDPCAVDDKILKDVLPLAGQMTDTQILNVGIYRPAQCATVNASLSYNVCPPDNGHYIAGDLLDLYDGSGNLVGTPSYTLDQRNQIQPLETQLGVYITFKYTAPAPRYDVTATQFATVRLIPTFS